MPSAESNHWNYVIAADMPVSEDWSFARYLGSRLNVSFRVVSADGRAHVPRWRRIMIYVVMAWRLFLHHRQMEVLVSWQQFFGLVFASLCQLFRVGKRTHVIVMTFIYRPKSGWIGRLYRWWVRRTLTSGYIERVLVFSHHEVDYYARLLGVDARLFHFAPLAIEMEDVEDIADDGYWFSTGKSNRDYEFLINAVAGTEHRLVIACDELPQPAASNIQVHHHAFGEQMLQLMGRSHGVIITLHDEHVSSGQLVALQAMALGKPLIVTRSQALADYVQDGVHALVIDKTPPALLQAMERLNQDTDLYHRLSVASRERFAGHHSIGALARDVASLLEHPVCTSHS
ncbi:MAG: glycosyltransferase family 4 protein [Muribaculaceae bacterium]|nr:glycosyltransferase family 4 protein [Muribaculaceae bacterium]